MTRYCPKCGEPVPSNCLTCPKCYAKIPSEPVKEERQSNGGSQKNESRKGGKDPTIRLILSVIPGFFGLLGLGMIYDDYKSTKGYFFLCIGLVLFLCANTLLFLPADLLVGIMKTIIAVGLLLVYIFLFIITVIGPVIHVKFAR